MPTSRREILQLLSASAAASLFDPKHVIAGLAGSSSVLAHSLFFGESELDAMRSRFEEDHRLARLRQELADFDRGGERRFLESEIRYNDQLYHISRVGKTAENMAFLYLMTGDEDAADLAVESIRAIMKFDRWDFFLEAGKHSIGVQRASSSTMAVSCVSDWLGELIDNDERRHWLSTMAQRGCEACYLGLYGIRYPREVVGWSFDPESTYFEHRPNNLTDMRRRPEITQTTNLRAVPAAALTIGALTHQDHFGDSEDVDRWLEMALFSLKIFGNVYMPDGSYDEGISYGNYTSTQIATASTALLRRGRSDLEGLVNWDGYVDYVRNMALPMNDNPYGIVNFGDNGSPRSGEHGGGIRTAVPFWIAHTHKNPEAQWFAAHLGGQSDIWSAMFMDPSVGEVPPEPGPTLWKSDLDWIVARTGFEADDLTVALRSGPPANHEHADRNGIIVKCFGEQLVTDPYRPPYSFSDPAWMMRLTAGHSAVLVDGQGHEHHNGVEGTNASRSHARITRAEEGKGFAWWTSDATQAYRLAELDIRDISRSVVVLYDQPAVIVVDRITKWKEPSFVQARFFGDNYDGKCAIQALDDGFVTRRPGAVMRATTFSRQQHLSRVDRLPIPEEIAARHPFAEVATDETSRDVTLVTVLGLGRSVADIGDVTFVESEGSVTIRIARTEVIVDDTTAYPDIRVKV